MFYTTSHKIFLFKEEQLCYYKDFYLVGTYSKKQFRLISVNIQDKKSINVIYHFLVPLMVRKKKLYSEHELYHSFMILVLKIWGDIGWEHEILKYHPKLKNCHTGKRLGFEALNILYQISKINLNLPNPQCIKTFQQRTFEIAGAKGFQIVDYRKDIDDYFNEDELVCFYNINDLKDKIKYFLKYPEKRKKYIENSYKKVQKEHTYEIRLKEMLGLIK